MVRLTLVENKSEAVTEAGSKAVFKHYCERCGKYYSIGIDEIINRYQEFGDDDDFALCENCNIEFVMENYGIDLRKERQQ